MQLLDVAERLQNEALYATLDEPGHLPAEVLDRFALPGRPPRLDPDAQRPDRAEHDGAPCGSAERDLDRRPVDFAVRSSSPYAESFTGLAPKVLVSRISAPARTYASWTSWTSSGWVRLSSS